jgi:hypothetical protein
LGTLLAERGCFLVRQRRENLVKVAVSHLRGQIYADLMKKRSGKPLWGVPRGERPLPPQPLDPRRFARLLLSVAQADEALMRFAPDCPIRDIVYEDLKQDPKRILHELLSWLELPAQRPPEILYSKATPDKLADAVPNLEELRTAARNVGLGDLDAMFDS